jgi:hypothetical protein
LNSGGVITIAIPNDLESFRNRIRVSLIRFGLSKDNSFGKLGLKQIKLDGSMDEIHLFHFTPRVLRNLLVREGFSVVSESLDPYYIRSGIKGVLHSIYYYACKIIETITHRNFYDTIWMVARIK